MHVENKKALKSTQKADCQKSDNNSDLLAIGFITKFQQQAQESAKPDMVLCLPVQMLIAYLTPIRGLPSEQHRRGAVPPE